MTIEAKAFQQATIEAALSALTGNGARRFLVADEVGLGKTIVAGGVIQRMPRRTENRPLCVLYVCSNLAIARQNMEGLLSFMSAEKKSAIGTIDRPSLLPTRERPTNEKVNVFQLTPDTAIPTRKGQPRGGKMEERALALSLLTKGVSDSRLYTAFRLSAGDESFGGWVRYFEAVANRRNGLGGIAFRKLFQQALRDVLDARADLGARIRKMLDDENHQDLVAAARTALAIAGLRSLKPDLVIFDEFQRFRDLTDVNEDPSDDEGTEAMSRKRAAARVLEAIRGDAGEGAPALLLLSATPYMPYRNSRERLVTSSRETHQSADFFDLVEFLAAGRDTADSARRLFSELREEFRTGDIASPRAKGLRRKLTELLLPLMSRTERQSFSSAMADTSTQEALPIDLGAGDLKQFQSLSESFSEAYRDWIVPLWQSVPLPMQTLGSRYSAWENRKSMPSEVSLSEVDRDSYRVPREWPHPRMRALVRRVSQPHIAMPWCRPSLPWWPLGGKWRSATGSTEDEKVLVFSRFRAVPTGVSGLLSYGMEAHLIAGKRFRNPVYGAKGAHWLKASSSLLELFHPSALLASLEPLHAPLGNLKGMRSEVKRQLWARLTQLGVKRALIQRPKRRGWELLAALEAKAGLWEASASAWEKLDDVASDDGSDPLSEALLRWREAAKKPCVDVSEAEAESLVALAMDAPGVVLLRAFNRHWPDAPSASDQLDHVLRTSWRGVRSYLNQRWFFADLVQRIGEGYPVAIRRAVLEGGFESMLDEHFWYLSQKPGIDWRGALSELDSGLGLRGANVTLHDTDGEDGPRSFRLRSHFAASMTEAKSRTESKADQAATGSVEASEDGDEPLRPDEVRRAFNSPFWPKVLVTTSIGQEGLDLHPWCKSLAHWDLASGPVALEQREGRITRFASLAVRRAVADSLKGDLVEDAEALSPWTRLATLAEAKLADDSGLAPWWVVDGAKCHNYVLAASNSEQLLHMEEACRERALYRLVLGMPDQTDLLNVLKVKLENRDPDDMRKACLDLSAFNQRPTKP